MSISFWIHHIILCFQSHICICTYVYIYTHIYACIYYHEYFMMYIFICIYSCMYYHACFMIYMYTCIYMPAHVIMSALWYTYVYVFLYILSWVIYGWVHICILLMHVRSESASGVSLLRSYPFSSLRQSLSLAWSLPIRLGWLAGKLQGFICLICVEIWRTHHHPCFLFMCFYRSSGSWNVVFMHL